MHASSSAAPSVVHRAARAIHRLDWLLILLAAPALLFPSPVRSLALLLVVAVWASAWIATGVILPRTPLDVPILLVLVMVLVSLGVTYSLELSLAKVTGIILGIAGYYVLVRHLAASPALIWGLWAYAAIGAAFALVGLLGTDWLLKFPVLDRIMRSLPGLIRGLPGVEEGLQPNYVAGALVLFLPVQLALLAGLPRRRAVLGPAVLLVGFAGLTALTLLLTQSRGGSMGLAVGLGVWLAWHGPRTRRLLAGGVALTVLVVLLVGPNRAAETLLAVSGRSSVVNLQGRVELWARALEAIQAFPLTGLGPNVFRRAVPVFFPLFIFPTDFDISHAHNQFLQAALDLGLPGLVAFVALAVGAFALLIAARRRTHHRERQLLAEGFAAALAAQLAFGLTDAIAFGARVHVFFWAALAYVVCLYLESQGGRAAPSPGDASAT